MLITCLGFICFCCLFFYFAHQLKRWSFAASMLTKSTTTCNNWLEPTHSPSCGTRRAWASWTTHFTLSKKIFKTSVNVHTASLLPFMKISLIYRTLLVALLAIFSMVYKWIAKTRTERDKTRPNEHWFLTKGITQSTRNLGYQLTIGATAIFCISLS